MSWRTSTLLILCCISCSGATQILPRSVPMAAETGSPGQQSEKIIRLQDKIARLTTALLNQSKTTLRLGGIIRRQEEHAKQVDTLLKSLSDRQSAFEELATNSKFIQPYNSAAAGALTLAATPTLVETPSDVPLDTPVAIANAPNTISLPEEAPTAATIPASTNSLSIFDEPPNDPDYAPVVPLAGRIAASAQSREIDAKYRKDVVSAETVSEDDVYEPEIILPDDSPSKGIKANERPLQKKSVGDVEEDNKLEDLVELPEPLADEDDTEAKANTPKMTVTSRSVKAATESGQKKSLAEKTIGDPKQNSKGTVKSPFDTSEVARALRKDIEKAKAENNKTALKEKLVQAKKFLEDNLKALQNQTHDANNNKDKPNKTHGANEPKQEVLHSANGTAKTNLTPNTKETATEQKGTKELAENQAMDKAKEVRNSEAKNSASPVIKQQEAKNSASPVINQQEATGTATAKGEVAPPTQTTPLVTSETDLKAGAATGKEVAATKHKKKAKGVKAGAAHKKSHKKNVINQNLKQKFNVGGQVKASGYGRGGDHHGRDQKSHHRRGHKHDGPILAAVNKGNAGMLVARRHADAAIEATTNKIGLTDTDTKALGKRFSPEEKHARQRLSEFTVAKSTRVEDGMASTGVAAADSEASKGVAATDSDAVDFQVSASDKAVLDESFSKLRKMLKGAQNTV